MSTTGAFGVTLDRRTVLPSGVERAKSGAVWPTDGGAACKWKEAAARRNSEEIRRYTMGTFLDRTILVRARPTCLISQLEQPKSRPALSFVGPRLNKGPCGNRLQLSDPC